MPAVIEAEAKLTAQNQITIPAPVRKYLRLQGGSRVKFKYSKGAIILIRTHAGPSSRRRDSTLRPFLDFLARDMEKHPKRIVPFPIKLLNRARSLVKGVEVDLNSPLSGAD
ncbi:MAG: type II toxin-antitoxin system PrlF family antitoxin [Methylacidiphilales bacterium]|nr:type II toxin-antitoxin system PrlF family antitoxin [Candidatus Methylacidiphilales bacterium]